MLIGRCTYIIPLQLQSHNNIVVYNYNLVFIAYISYNPIAGAGKALAQLFFAIAVILLLIPATSVLAYMFPIQGLWYSTGTLIWIDVIALLFALVFIRFYQQARDRAQNAPVGSIWSTQKVEQISSLTENQA